MCALGACRASLPEPESSFEIINNKPELHLINWRKSEKVHTIDLPQSENVNEIRGLSK